MDFKSQVMIVAAICLCSGVSGQSEWNKTIDNKQSYVCPPSFVRLSHKCYYFSEAQETWQDAYWKCRDLRSNLATIKNPNQDKILRRTLERNPIEASERWIGGRYDWKNGGWLWAASSRPLQYSGFTRLDENQSLQWNCIILDPTLHYRWNAKNCMESKRYICMTKIKIASDKDKRRLRKQYNASKHNKLNEIPVPDSVNQVDSNLLDNNLKQVKFARRAPSVRRTKNWEKRRLDRLKSDNVSDVLNDSPPAFDMHRLGSQKEKVLRKKKSNNKKNYTRKNQASSKDDLLRYKTFYAASQSPMHPSVIVEEFSFNRGFNR